MKTLPVGELKTKFSKVISDVKSGEKILITYGKKKENIAVIIPYYSRTSARSFSATLRIPVKVAPYLPDSL